MVHYSLPRPRTVSARSRFLGNICANEWIVSPMLFAQHRIVFLGNMIFPRSILLSMSRLSFTFRGLSSRLQNNTDVSIPEPSLMILLTSDYLVIEHLIMPCLRLASQCMWVLAPRASRLLISAKPGVSVLVCRWDPFVLKIQELNSKMWARQQAESF